ncbi:MAG: hypothetical protein OXC30_04680 [Alphaproteobacteria bacterium]|nr:hypothetical protein [Alphaproteobacteria bacterium]
MSFFVYLFLWCTAFLSQAAEAIDPFHWAKVLGPFRLVLSRQPYRDNTEKKLLAKLLFMHIHKMPAIADADLPSGDEQDLYHCFYIP